MNNQPNQQGNQFPNPQGPNYHYQQGQPYPQQDQPYPQQGYNNIHPNQQNFQQPLIYPNNHQQNDGIVHYHRNIDNVSRTPIINNYISQPVENIIMTEESSQDSCHTHGPLPKHSVVVNCKRCHYTGYSRVVREIDPGCLCCLIIMIIFPPLWIFLIFFCCCIECCGRVDIHKCNSCRNFIGYARR